MIRRLLFLVLAAIAVFWWLRRLLGAGRARGAHRPPAAGSARPSEAMVRDRVCNTFLPRSRAIRARVGDETLFFCSEECRRSFLRERQAADSRAETAPRA